MADNRIKEIEKMRHSVLEKVEQELNDALIAAEIRSPENLEDNMGIEILTVLFDELGVGPDEAVGEFFFYPLGSEDDVTGILGCVFTIADEINQAVLPQLYEAISILNFHILTGSFAIDKDKNLLVYRQCVPYPLSMTEEMLYEFVNTVTGNATLILDRWMDMVLRIAEGEAGLEDILDVLEG